VLQYNKVVTCTACGGHMQHPTNQTVREVSNHPNSLIYVYLGIGAHWSIEVCAWCTLLHHPCRGSIQACSCKGPVNQIQLRLRWQLRSPQQGDCCIWRLHLKC